MNSYRNTARIVGVLFLIALVFNIIAMGIYQPILNAPDYLANASPNKIQVITGILLDFICVPAIIFIPIMLFPVFKQHNERLALGYVVFRFFEGILFTISLINWLSLMSLSQESINSITPDASKYQATGMYIHANIDWATLIYIIVFTLGALIFYYLLYQSKLIPRFLSVWGFLAAVLLLTGALLGLFGFIPLLKAMAFFSPPIALNELILAIWLIVKGFNSSVIASGSAKMDGNNTESPD
ncbi:DUF4386 domain-containing protein [Candidatus Neomarinimicrobiota bacterium]